MLIWQARQRGATKGPMRKGKIATPSTPATIFRSARITCQVSSPFLHLLHPGPDLELEHPTSTFFNSTRQHTTTINKVDFNFLVLLSLAWLVPDCLTFTQDCLKNPAFLQLIIVSSLLPFLLIIICHPSSTCADFPDLDPFTTTVTIEPSEIACHIHRQLHTHRLLATPQ